MRVPEQLLADSALKQKQMKTCKKLNLNLARYVELCLKAIENAHLQSHGTFIFPIIFQKFVKMIKNSNLELSVFEEQIKNCQKCVKKLLKIFRLKYIVFLSSII